MRSTATLLMAAALGLINTTHAHMKMGTPFPYGRSSLDNGPLNKDGSEFPCKQRAGVYADEGALALNQMKIGENQRLSFIGGATHEGGSCQVSLTTDKEPTKDSKWKVIHSIEGGCPLGGNDNLSDNPNDTRAKNYTFQIPDVVKTGQYTLAWTWHNKESSGPEFYMNCAPINVIGGSKKRETIAKRDGFSDLPDMFVANQGPTIGNGCTRDAGTEIKFPDPGKSLEIGIPENQLVSPTCPGSVVGPPKTGGDSGSPAVPAGGAALQESSIIITPIAAPTPAPAPASPAAPVISAAPAPAPGPGTSASPAPAAAPAAAPISGGNASGTCTIPGQSVCSPDGSQIGTCDPSNHVTFMAVAPGTVCKGGYMVMAKRSARFATGHVRRGANLGRW